MKKNQAGNDVKHTLVDLVRKISGLTFILVLVFPALFFDIRFSGNLNSEDASSRLKKDTTDPLVSETKYWSAPDISMIKDPELKKLIENGRDIISRTSYYFGPKGIVSGNATNGMNCQNCHLQAGTKIFGINYSAVASTYPKYRARSGTIENIYKRINDCFERSLNGNVLTEDSKEMQAIAAYINFVGSKVPKGDKPKGSGFKEIVYMDRPCDSIKGKTVYMNKCISCHMENGEGQLNAEKSGFLYPPLWGINSYNTGAGLFRISSFAKFVKYNMPDGVTHTNAQLTDEEAWDIAAYVNSRPRPEKDISNDWPKKEEKPFDYAFGPYADGFSEKQHKFGPFKPIIEKQETQKKLLNKVKNEKKP